MSQAIVYASGRVPAAALRPTRVHAVSPLAAALAHSSALRRAAAHLFRLACAASPRSSRAWNGLGVCADFAPLAQHALARSVALGGGGIALCNAGALYLEQGRARLASAALLQSQTKDPSNEAMWIARGMITDATEAAAALERGDAGGARDAEAVQVSAGAYELATQLSLHPAALLPSALLALELAGGGARDGGGDARVVALAAARTAAERDPCSVGALVVLAAAEAAVAAETTAAADLCCGVFSLAGGAFAAAFAAPPGAPQRAQLVRLLLLHARPAPLTALFSGLCSTPPAARATAPVAPRSAAAPFFPPPTLSAAAAGWARTAEACAAARARLGFATGAEGGEDAPGDSCAGALRALGEYAALLAAMLSAACGRGGADGDADVEALAPRVWALTASLGEAESAGAGLGSGGLFACLRALGGGEAGAFERLRAFLQRCPGSVVATAALAQALAATGGRGARAEAAALAERARALFERVRARARYSARLVGGASAADGGPESWGEEGEREEARVLATPAGDAAFGAWVSLL
jgi:hypothetical protein